MSDAALAASLGAALGGRAERRGERWFVRGAALFVKQLPLVAAPRLAAEADGLARLAATATLRTPRVLGLGGTDSQAWLALEWLDLRPPDAAAEAALGSGLAQLHRCTAAAFGLAADNFIGGGAQPNGWLDDWPAFLVERRLRPQLARAARGGGGQRLVARAERLLECLPAFYAGYRPVPSLLHGDLWGGNRTMLADGAAVVYDPAVYYGDREADIAMTRLFGGFGAAFYAAYEAAWPSDRGAAGRAGLLNLYHVLNHLNLFGGGYAAAAEALIEQLLATLGRP